MNERREIIVCVAECRNDLRATLRALMRPEPDVNEALRMLDRIASRCESTIDVVSDAE